MATTVKAGRKAAGSKNKSSRSVGAKQGHSGKSSKSTKSSKSSLRKPRSKGRKVTSRRLRPAAAKRKRAVRSAAPAIQLPALLQGGPSFQAGFQQTYTEGYQAGFGQGYEEGLQFAYEASA